MSEMIEMMTKKIFLEVCMRIEGLCADLYHHYSEVYEDVPDASKLWKKTALEEENHKLQFELALRLMDENEFEFSNDSLKRAYSIQRKLLQLMEHVKNNKPELLTAVTKAVEMEDKLADLHVNTALKFKEESLQKLFSALGEDDRSHVSALQRLQTILELPHCEMRG